MCSLTDVRGGHGPRGRHIAGAGRAHVPAARRAVDAARGAAAAVEGAAARRRHRTHRGRHLGRCVHRARAAQTQSGLRYGL